MKYINAEKLKAEIKRLEEMDYPCDTYDESVGFYNALDRIKDFIGSLQQEQPDFPITDEQIKEFLATHPKIKVPEKYKNPDWLLNKQEQPEVDLVEEIDKVWNNGLSDELAGPHNIFNICARLARHFYELGKRNARKEGTK